MPTLNRYAVPREGLPADEYLDLCMNLPIEFAEGADRAITCLPHAEVVEVVGIIATLTPIASEEV